MAEESESLKWIFRGNVVVPTGNPFAVATANGGADVMEQQAAGDPNGNVHCHWLGPGLKLLLNHVLTVDRSGIIRHVQPAETFLAAHQHGLDSVSECCDTYVELQDNEFLCPGMIDLHIHAPQFSYTGTATDKPLMGNDGWLFSYTFPAERSLRDVTRAQKVYNGVVSTTLRTGTTTAVYFATLDLDPCKVLVDCVIEKGQRALVGKVCMDRNSPNDYCQSLEQNLADTKKLIDYIYSKVGRRRNMRENDTSGEILPLVLPLITPRFIPTCTPELMTGLGALAAEYDCHITSHISESIDEVAFSRQLDAEIDCCDDGGGGRTDAVIFDSHKLLTNQCIMAHGVHLTDSDYDLIKERGSAVAHCPLSNFFFAGGVLPCRRILKRGNLVGLGTDVAGGYNPSMLHSSRMAVVASQALQQKQQQGLTSTTAGQDNVMDYRHAFYLATLGGAESLGLQHRIGTLAVGLEFDAVVLSAGVQPSPLQTFDSDTLADVFQKLCVLGDDRNVTRVFVQGRDVTLS